MMWYIIFTLEVLWMLWLVWCYRHSDTDLDRGNTTFMAWLSACIFVIGDLILWGIIHLIRWIVR